MELHGNNILLILEMSPIRINGSRTFIGQSSRKRYKVLLSFTLKNLLHLCPVCQIADRVFLIDMAIFTIFQQILVLAIISLIGVLAVQFKVLNNDAKNVIEKIVFYITLPLLIITKLASLEISDQILKNGF